MDIDAFNRIPILISDQRYKRMFIVFSSGNLEREIILTGMGIALLTTLIGLIVSIALNFSSTLVYSYFMKRLDQVKA